MSPFKTPTKRPPKKKRPVYRTSTGQIVPSVTTALGIINKPGLIKWANRLGLQGLDVDEQRDKAADAGTLAHAFIEATLKGKKADVTGYSKEHIELAMRSWGAFRQWRKLHEIEVLAQERILVSDVHEYGGTFDLYAVVDGRHEVLDFKTSGRIYDEHIIQLSAYRAMFLEHGYECEAVRVLQFDRENGAWSERVEEDTERYFAVFLAALALYKAHDRL